MISIDMLCVCMSLALQGKTNYLFGFQENMFILPILCALKGQGHEVLENVSEGCSSLLKTSSMRLSLVLLLFFSLPEMSIKSKERERQRYIVTSAAATNS
jgi:hypothetical protein